MTLKLNRYASDDRALTPHPEKATNHTWTYIACAIALFSCFMMYSGIAASLSERDLLARGVTAKAVVTELKTEHSSDSSGSSRSYYVTSEFTTASGEKIDERNPVSAGYFRNLKIGQNVQMLYHPERPNFNTLEPSTRWWMFGLMAVLLSLPLLVGSVWYVWGILRKRSS